MRNLEKGFVDMQSHSDQPEGTLQSHSDPAEGERRSTHINTATGVSEFCLPADVQAELLRVIADIRAGLLQDLAAIRADSAALRADGVRALAPVSAQLDELLAESGVAHE